MPRVIYIPDEKRKKFFIQIAKKTALCIDILVLECYIFSMLKKQHITGIFNEGPTYEGT